MNGGRNASHDWVSRYQIFFEIDVRFNLEPCCKCPKAKPLQVNRTFDVVRSMEALLSVMEAGCFNATPFVQDPVRACHQTRQRRIVSSLEYQ